MTLFVLNKNSFSSNHHFLLRIKDRFSDYNLRLTISLLVHYPHFALTRLSCADSRLRGALSDYPNSKKLQSIVASRELFAWPSRGTSR